MFTTQLSGLLKRISEKEEFAIEDAGRLLSQGLLGEGTLYMKGFGEMAALEAEAIHGAEPIAGVQNWTKDALLTEADRVLIATRFSDDPEAFKLADELLSNHIPFAAIASKREAAGIEESADVFIDLHLTKGLLPDEEGGRTGFPSPIAGLYVYYLLKMTIDEMTAEYE
ncbi:DUF2529 family protein [Domibacillus robiginosus]|uniref:DUF2529 family protein n=1 Tax=Domibacillus robiginosus TaxID=1071054 RepID=UPI000A5FCDA6|nr:DUF2529 family protein [Domibacillus robiginosus]